MESNLTWTETGKHNDVNLIDKEGKTLFSDVNVASEFREWLSPYNLAVYNVIFVYGSAIGYPIFHLLSWLNVDPSRRLILLDDDEELFDKTRSRKEVKAFLEHPQIIFYFLPMHEEDKLFYNISQMAGIHQTLFLSSPGADPKKGDYYKAIYEFIRFGYLTYISEFLDGGKVHFENYYKNLIRWVESAPLSAFFNHFKGIPALIVGAGPSLGKNIGLIKKLKNKALILSGGTAVNGLNAGGVDPHLAIGLDPFETTISRLLASTSFLTPFIYKERMNEKALSYVHGPLIFLDGGMAFKIEEWFMKKFNLEKQPVELGTNVLNSAVSIAYNLGIRKIILAGIDLAFSDAQVYAPKIRRHGSVLKQIRAMSSNEEVLLSKDIYGKPVNTLKKWIQESIWIGDFQLRHKEATLINATEGGLGFPHIANVPLKHIHEFDKEYDIEGLIHAIWASHPLGATREKMKEAFKEFVTSLGIMLTRLTRIGAESPEHRKSYTFDMAPFKGEMAYDHFLIEFDEIYDQFYQGNSLADGSVTPYMGGFMKKIPFLISVVRLHLRLITEMFEEWEKRPYIGREEAIEGTLEHKEEEGESRYYYADRLLAKTKKGEYALYYFMNGKVALSKKYKEGELHGPVIAYYPDGVVSAELEYDKGVLDGTQKLFYPNGKLKRTLRFKQGKREGADLIYSDKGDLVNESHYEDDEPVKQAIVYYPGKRKALEIQYNDKHEIVLHQEWDERGQLKNSTQTNYLAGITSGSALLQKGLNSIHEEIQKALLSKESDPSLLNEVKKLDKEFENLKELSKEMEKAGSNELLNTSQVKESIKREVTKHYLEMGDIFAGIEQQLKVLKGKLEP